MYEFSRSHERRALFERRKVNESFISIDDCFDTSSEAVTCPGQTIFSILGIVLIMAKVEGFIVL